MNATVLCAGGDHLDDDGSFLVAFVGSYVDGVFTYVYSSDAGAWSEPSMAEKAIEFVDSVPAALVGNAVHFLVSISMRILKYDLGTRENSFLHMPPESYGYQQNMIMTTEQGKLGLARLDGFKLYLWSMEEVSPQGDDAVWTQDWVIELQNLLPADALLNPPAVVGCVHDRGGIVLVGTADVALFAIDPKLNQAINVGEGIPFKDDEVGLNLFFVVLPYSSFYFPGTYKLSIHFILPMFTF